MQLLNVTDPRDNLAKAKRTELVSYAHKEGQTDITPAMPAILIRNILRSRGLSRIQIPRRVIGERVDWKTGGKSAPEANPDTPASVEVNMEDDLARQFAASSAPKIVTPENMTMPQLRMACKDKGIKMVRKDNAATLREKLNGAHTAELHK